MAMKGGEHKKTALFRAGASCLHSKKDGFLLLAPLLAFRYGSTEAKRIVAL